MELILLCIFLLRGFVRAEDDIEEDQRFIDLLSEDDKQAFLDQVARRLFKETKRKDATVEKNSGSRELSNEDLDEHSKFVQRILAEESKNLRRQRNNDGNRAVPEEEFEAKEKNEQKSANKIDLTLRNNQRPRRFSENFDSGNVNIPVAVVYDRNNASEKTAIIKNVDSKNNVAITTTPASSDEKDIQVRHVKRISNVSNPPKITDFKPQEEDGKYDSQQEDIATTIQESTHISIVSSESDKASVETVNTEPTTEKFTTAATETTTESESTSTTISVTSNTGQQNSQTDITARRKQYLRNGLDDENEKQSGELSTTSQPQSLNSDEENKTVNINSSMEGTTEIIENLQNKLHSRNGETSNETDGSSETTTKTPLLEEENVSSTYSTDEATTEINKDLFEYGTEDSSFAEKSSTNTIHLTDEAITNVSAQDVDLITTTDVSSTSEVYTFRVKPEENNLTKNNNDVFQPEDLDALTAPTTISNVNKENLDQDTTTVTPVVSEVVVNLISTTTEVPTITAKSISKDTAQTDVNISNKIGDFNENERINSARKEAAVFSDLLKALRHELQQKDQNKAVTITKQKNENEKPKEYLVYEISPDEPSGSSAHAFVKQNDESEKNALRFNEEPFYAPIYNYSPENAYFNAQNRFGPNHEDDNDVIVKKDIENIDIERAKHFDEVSNEQSPKEALRKFKFYTNKPEFKIQDPNPIHNQKLKMPFVVGTPKLGEVHFNPNDYLDMDYYFGRMGSPRDTIQQKKKRIFESSDENLNPYDKIDFFNTKDHLIDIRQFLFKHKIELADKTKKSFAKLKLVNPKNRSSYIIFVPDIHLRNSMRDDISMDYYFDLHENRYEKDSLRLFHIKKNKNKNGIQRFKGKNKRDPTKTGTLRELLTISNPSEVFSNLEKLLKLNVPLGRSVETSKLKPYENVIKDMIQVDNKALQQYDWLGTTVDILAAVDKLTNLIYSSYDGKKIHPADLQLLNYIEYLFSMSKSTIKGINSKDLEELKETQKKKTNTEKNLTKRISLPRNRAKTKTKNFLNAKGLIDRLWLYIRGRRRKHKESPSLKELLYFLEDLRDALYDLHTALKNIASVTTFKKQNWYRNLKDLYLKDSKRKHHLELLLHLSSARLLDLIEETAGKGLEHSYLAFIEDNEEDVDRSKEELEFLMQVLSEIKKLGR